MDHRLVDGLLTRPICAHDLGHEHGQGFGGWKQSFPMFGQMIFQFIEQQITG